MESVEHVAVLERETRSIVAARDAPCWMWMPDHQTAGAVDRRCANELSIHRDDAQSASGNVMPLDAAIAMDAIEEIFDMLPVWDTPPEASGETLGLRAAEGGQRTIMNPSITAPEELDHAAEAP